MTWCTATDHGTAGRPPVPGVPAGGPTVIRMTCSFVEEVASQVVAEPGTQDHSVEEEQRFLDRAYEGLEVMRDDARAMLNSVLDLGRGGTFQSRTERDIVVRTSLARLAQLDIGDEALCFGRIDRLAEFGGEERPGQSPGTEDGRAGRREDPRPALESFHIGRVAVSGPGHEPLVVDWRAPVAEPFYRATGLDPQGLARRRHLAVRARRVIGLEDEYFVQPDLWPGARDGRPFEEEVSADGLVLGGPAALLSALGSARTGRMGDIVATIQREQDEVIRSPLAGVLMVQGGPGTGKTAVALHRAAYLLYTHRFPLERQGVLVVGPNPLFLRYIEQVLPSLGETGVTLSTVTGLVPEIKARSAESTALAALKGDPRMARVLARGVRTRERGLRREVAIPYGATVLRLSPRDSEAIVAATRRRRGTHNAKRRFLETLTLRRLFEQLGPVGDGNGDGGEEELAEMRQRLRRNPAFVEALDRMWPRLAPHEFVHDLLGARPLLAAAGRGVLSAHEQSLLYRPRSSSLDQVPWTTADAALVDEARALLGPRRQRPPRRERAEGRAAAAFGDGPLPGAQEGPPALELPEEGYRSYGHIVIDEVQGLSPMQLRMLARRSLSGSMTVVGDIAQATGASSTDSWDQIARHLGQEHPVRQVDLTVCYRTPAEIVALASRVLEVVAPGLSPPTPVRRAGVPPRRVEATAATLPGEVAQVVEGEVGEVAPGKVAVLAPAALLDRLSAAMEARDIEVVDPRLPGPGLAAPVVLLPPEAANGLEFDAVVLVEPALVAAGLDGDEETPAPPRPRGLRSLYVALTRATRRLTVVHARPLPEVLTPFPEPSGAQAAP
jgi:DNA helicase IV